MTMLESNLASRRTQAEFLRANLLSTVIIVAFFLLIIVLPNSFRLLKLGLFPGLALYSFAKLRGMDSEMLFVGLAMSLTTVFYSLFPPQPLLTPKIFLQFFYVYALSPICWMLIANYVLRTYSFDQIRNFLVWTTILSMLSMFLFYYLFTNYGADAVWIFMDKDHANVKMDHEANDYKATMHVFGSLIFVGAAFIASETLSIAKKTLLIVVLGVTAFYAGRDALVLALGIGAVIYMMFRYIDLAQQKVSVSALVVTLLAGMLCYTEYGQDLIGSLFEKLQDAGGSERQQQFRGIVDGIRKNWMLGGGLTTHATYIRDVEQPWRYEIMPLALLNRVGLVGFLIFAFPAISSVYRMAKLVRSNLQNQIDIFMIAGLISILVATMTNPYLDSFEFQWCLFFPYCYFRLRMMQPDVNPVPTHALSIAG